MNDLPSDSQPHTSAGEGSHISTDITLHAETILMKAFDYAADNSHEAFAGYESTVNLYLLLVGGVAASLGTVLQFGGGRSSLSLPAIAVVLFAGSVLSATLFARYVARRVTYTESMISASLIVEYYVRHFGDTMPNLQDAFRWRLHNIPVTQRFGAIGFIVRYPMAWGGSLCFSAAVYIAFNLLFASFPPVTSRLLPAATLSSGSAIVAFLGTFLIQIGYYLYVSRRLRLNLAKLSSKVQA